MPTKFGIPAQAQGYSMAPGGRIIATKLDGGRSRYRRDVLNACSTVNVSWELNAAEYNYLWAFFRTTLQDGSLPMEIDLVMEASGKVECVANFVPDSLQLNGQQGGVYKVSAQLEVEAITRNATADAALVAAYNAAHGVT